ncbi:MAG TPA: glycosyltransferase family 2 protein [Candidatus Acidoferrales bacterium]|nr:glycosyltransferase family 2 protein [Candidatus Acidoferrales bacterium]
MQKVSAIVIAGREEKNIADCLESLRWADEIVVVNSESNDRTVEIARQFTDKIFIRKWEGYASQKRFSLQQATNEWVLSIDADERVSPELCSEILSLDFSKADGFYIPRRNYFLGRVIRSCGWSPDYQLRLFKKSKTSVTDRHVHEGFAVDGKKDYLKSELIHYTHSTISGTLDKINEYSALEAQEKAGRVRMTGAKIFFKPLWAFIQHFIMRRGFTDGVSGLMVSIIHAMTKTQVYMKIWEMQNDRKKR